MGVKEEYKAFTNEEPINSQGEPDVDYVDWLEAQLALYFLQMVKIEEIFLPYMYNQRTGKTMFQMLEEKGFNLQIEN